MHTTTTVEALQRGRRQEASVWRSREMKVPGRSNGECKSPVVSRAVTEEEEGFQALGTTIRILDLSLSPVGASGGRKGRIHLPWD